MYITHLRVSFHTFYDLKVLWYVCISVPKTTIDCSSLVWITNQHYVVLSSRLSSIHQGKSFLLGFKEYAPG